MGIEFEGIYEHGSAQEMDNYVIACSQAGSNSLLIRYEVGTTDDGELYESAIDVRLLGVGVGAGLLLSIYKYVAGPGGESGCQPDQPDDGEGSSQRGNKSDGSCEVVAEEKGRNGGGCAGKLPCQASGGRAEGLFGSVRYAKYINIQAEDTQVGMLDPSAHRVAGGSPSDFYREAGPLLLLWVGHLRVVVSSAYEGVPLQELLAGGSP